MVTNKKSIPVLRGRKAALLAFTPAFLTAAMPAYVPVGTGLVMPYAVFLVAIAVLGIVLFRRQAEAEHRPRARTAAPGPQQAGAAAPLVLRPPRADAGGPAFLLRELARTADGQAGPAQARPAKPALVAEEMRGQACLPDPCLLPSLHRFAGEMAVLDGPERAPALQRAG
ncbi:hypothetical protein [Microvirga arsenatis]|uniref:Uncharacterized protein n=3 Tax=Microvirga arsenatis TaxID=2692265 RepID=A0ABW9Z0R5_9HYPH|nr:hypothetical protein [Microvirga arsenatis]NBJ26258.1 hypothetical protein [Microvirga arsenatis]